ncbi:myoneurin-like isoform X2 [Mytilus trossulus]|uniref:myoneurin-like isoform X2 n=1 Tax=Mytilus trossulus TaxID=6551 RepID=UPI0030077812
MMAKVFLKEDRYGEKLLKTLNVLRKERKYSDFYIETNSGLVPVHRVVLAAAESCHLKSIGFLCGDINTFDLTEFNKNIVETLVTYLYTGEVDLTGDSDIKDFVNLCQKLDFQSLLNRKEFQKGNSNEVSEKHTNEVFENNTVNNKDSKSGPHPIYLATNRDGQMFVKSVSSVHSNDNHINHDNHDNQNTDVSNTPKLSESTESGSLQDFIIKKEPNSDDDNSDNELDSVEEESGSSQSNKSKQKRPNKKTLEGKNKKLKSSTKSVKQYAEQLVSKVVGMGEEGGDVEEDSGDNNDNDDAGDADNQEESQKDFVIKEEQDTAERKIPHQGASNRDQSNAGTDRTTKKMLKCNDCDFTTPWPSSLYRHRRIHDQNMFFCDQCDSRFPDLCMLKVHTKHKHGEGLICTHCSKRFTSLAGLNYHLKKISGEYKRKCTFCDKTFISIQHYESHVNKHKNIKPHKCDICQKAFLYKAHLTQHIEKGHSENNEPRTYQCEVCDIILTSKAAHRGHMIGKHSNNVRVCSTCGKSFNWAASYYRHIKSHA